MTPEEYVAQIEKHLDVGTGELTTERWRVAAELADQMCTAFPHEARAYLAMARVLMHRRYWDVAGANFERAIALARPDQREFQAEAWLGLSVVRELTVDFASALEAADRARALVPDAPAVLLKCADMLREQHRYVDAEKFYEQALAQRPRWADALYMRSFLYFRQWRWEEAWEGYLARWGCDGFYRSAELSGKPSKEKPFWTGTPLAGRRLLVWTEQGVGDILWTSRWIDVLLAKHAGDDITLRVSPALFRHLQVQYGDRCAVVCTHAMERQGDQALLTPLPWPEFDVHVPVMNLPAVLEEYRPSEVRHRALEPLTWGPQLTVGIVWAGAPGFLYDRMRSTEFADWAPILQTPGFRFVSLQVGPRAADSAGSIVEPMPSVLDYADTANVIAKLDLVIGVDTGVMHLASLLGVPTWWIIGPRPDWRADTGKNSLWYSAARMWHRENRSWPELFSHVARELAKVHPVRA